LCIIPYFILHSKSENQNIASLIRIISEFNIKEFFRFELEQKKKMALIDLKSGKKDDPNNKLKNKKTVKSKDNSDDKKIYNNSINNSNDNNSLLNNDENEKPIDIIENFDIEAFRINKEHLNNPELVRLIFHLIIIKILVLLKMNII